MEFYDLRWSDQDMVHTDLGHKRCEYDTVGNSTSWSGHSPDSDR